MKKKDNSIVSETILSEEDVSNDYELNDDSNYDYNDTDLDQEDSDVEEFSSDDEAYQDDGTEDYVPEPKENKLKKILIPLVIVVLLGIVGVLAFNVVKKYNENKTYEDKSAELVADEPDNPDIYVSTVPTEKPKEVTPAPTQEPTPTAEPEKDIEEILKELEEEDDEEAKEEEKKDEDSLDLESGEASLSLEEADTEKIKESYKDIAVYFTDGLNTFHTKDCSVIKDKNKVKTTAYAALEDGYEECDVCNPLRNKTLASLSADDLKLLGEIVVYKTPSNTRYHKENCSILKDNGIKITLREAIESGLEACPQCNPKTLDNFKEDDTVKKVTPTPTKDNKNSTSSSNSSSGKSNGVIPIITPAPKTGNTGTTIIKPTTTPSVVNVTSLSLLGGNEVKVGGTLQLAFTCLPTNANVTLTYASSNNLVATINGNGLVTGVSNGTVTISLSAPNGLVAYKVITVGTGSVTPTPTVVPTTTPTPTVTPTTTPSNNDVDLTLDLNNLGLTSVSQFIDPQEINLIDMESMSDWITFNKKVDANGGALTVTSNSVSLTVGGVTRLQLTKVNDTLWSIRVYDTLYTYLNRCVVKAMCTKISSTPDTLYTSIYKDHEESEFIGERFRAIGDSYIRSEVIGGSTTYYIKDVTYEY